MKSPHIAIVVPLTVLSMTVTLFSEIKVAKVEKLSLPLLATSIEGTLPDLLSNISFHTHCTNLSSGTKLQMTHG